MTSVKERYVSFYREHAAELLLPKNETNVMGERTVPVERRKGQYHGDRGQHSEYKVGYQRFIGQRTDDEVHANECGVENRSVRFVRPLS